MQAEDQGSENPIHSVTLDPTVVDALSVDPGHLPLEGYVIYKGFDFNRAGAAVSSVSANRTFEPLSDDRQPYIELRRARLRYGEIGITYNNVETRLRTPKPTNYFSLAIPLSVAATKWTAVGACSTASPKSRLPISRPTSTVTV